MTTTLAVLNSDMSNDENLSLSVSSNGTIKDKLGANVIALNAEKKQLLFQTQDSHNARCVVIDLNSLNGCSVTKEYDNIKAGDLRTNKLHKFLKKILLNLRSLNGPVSLPVYNAQNDLHADVKLLESKAKKWQGIVARFLKTRVQKNKI
jgi:hypothetical protein